MHKVPAGVTVFKTSEIKNERIEERKKYILNKSKNEIGVWKETK